MCAIIDINAFRICLSWAMQALDFFHFTVYSVHPCFVLNSSHSQTLQTPCMQKLRVGKWVLDMVIFILQV